MKKIIISLSIIAVVAVISIGITTAYFTDTETSEDNTMAAGTMDLNIDGGNTAVQTMKVDLFDQAPGDSGIETAILKNVGSLSGLLDIKVETVTNYPCTNGNYGANDGTENCTSDAGTLGANAKMALYIDVDKSGTWNTGDIGLKPGDSPYPYDSNPLVYYIIDSYSNVPWNNVYAGLMGVDDEDDFVIDWEIPIGAGNEIQGDAVNFDVTFTLRQETAPNSN